MSIEHNITTLCKTIAAKRGRLLVVSKNQPLEKIRLAYHAGQRAFGENRIKELVHKRENLPEDIEWHMIGHLQTNKVKYIAPFISLIHTVDSDKLLHEINKQGSKIDRVIPCLLQIKIATESSKFGMQHDEAAALLATIDEYRFVAIKGLMGMATLTDDEHQIRAEFDQLRRLQAQLQQRNYGDRVALEELSMGMSADYTIALEMGSTIVRIGTAVFA